MFGVVYKFLWIRRFVMPGYLGRPTFISGAKRISIGRRVRIFPGVRMEAGKSGFIEIGNDIAIAQNVHITCGARVHIADGTCIAANVCITDTRHSYEDISINVLKQQDQFMTTYIGSDCFIGFGSVIHAGTKLGRHCIVGANSVVSGEFPDYTVIAGIPARAIRKYDPALGEWSAM